MPPSWLSSPFKDKAKYSKNEREDAGVEKLAEATPETTHQRSAPIVYAETRPTPHRFAPGTGPQGYGQMVQANNLGMMGGAVLGMASGDGVGWACWKDRSAQIW